MARRHGHDQRRARALLQPIDRPPVSEWDAWWRTPLRARLYVVTLVVSGIAVTVVGLHALSVVDTWPLLALLAGSAASIELGRLAEGGRVEGQRIHKGLSAWPFAAALLLPFGAGGVVAVVSYAHAHWRGIRITRWKWIGSCFVVTLASAAAGSAAGHPLRGAGDATTVLRSGGAAIAFLAVEAALFWVISRLNDGDDERQLRAHLATTTFYTVEGAVLAFGAVAAVLTARTPGMLVFAAPGLMLVQRGLLHQPLRLEAKHDTKTGVLNWDAWLATAGDLLPSETVAVLLVDVDHFKTVNDAHGHLAGDAVLHAAAEAVCSCVRASDLVGRFGGDEFCALLTSTTAADAAAVAERVRAGVSEAAQAATGLSVTVSVGAAMGGANDELLEIVQAADAALYRAKRAGRDRVDFYVAV